MILSTCVCQMLLVIVGHGSPLVADMWWLRVLIVTFSLLGIRACVEGNCVANAQEIEQAHLSLWPSDRLHFCFAGGVQLSLPRFPAMDDSRLCH